jgi:hypothetical protein
MIFYLLLILILLKSHLYLAISTLGFSYTILNHKGTRPGTNAFSCYECGKTYVPTFALKFSNKMFMCYSEYTLQYCMEAILVSYLSPVLGHEDQ